VLISNSKNPQSLDVTIGQLGKKQLRLPLQKAASADIVLLALPWAQVKTLTKITDWKGRVVIDATNHFTPSFDLEDLGDRASSEVLLDYLPGARLVKAFNTLYFKVLALDPNTENGHRVLFVSGDDAEAKAEVSEVIEQIGFAPVNLGSLAVGSKLQQAKGALSILNLIKL
jgi:predicted dinucleotide-binding enzyme